MRKVLVSLPMVSAATPVAKVISMLTEMESKGQALLKEEAQTFYDVDETTNFELNGLKLDMEHNGEKIEQFTAERDQADAEMSKFQGEIDQLVANLEELNAQKSQQETEKADEQKAFDAKQADLQESVDALERAVDVVTKKIDSPITTSFLQKLAVTVKSDELTALVQQPQATNTAYESKSGGIVNLLKKLLKKFSKELYDEQAAHANRQSDFNLQISHLTADIKFHTETQAEKQGLHDEAEGNKNEAVANLKAENADLASNKATHGAKTSYLKKYTNTYNQNQVVRKDELKALNTAIEILSGNSVKGNSEKYAGQSGVRGFIQSTQKSVSFLQVKKDSNSGSLLSRVASMLQQSNKSNFGNKSIALSLASVSMSTGGAMNKVVKMIEDLVKRLEEQAGAEAEHKAYCDKALKENQEEKDKKAAAVKKLTTKRDQLNDKIAELAKTSADAKKAEQKALADLAKETKIRAEENKVNTETIADGNDAVKAVTAALGALNEFYNKAALLQQPQLEAYTGQSGDGVIGLLETVKSDFERLVSETTTEEAEHLAAFEKESKRLNKLAVDKHDLAHKSDMTQDQKEFERDNTVADLKTEQEALDAAVTLFENTLKPSCVVVKVSYEERVAQREQEVQNLEGALKILQDNSDYDTLN